MGATMRDIKTESLQLAATTRARGNDRADSAGLAWRVQAGFGRGIS